ncbi:MAG: metal-dependent phosphohydrolase [Treponema sp.]|nr:metal-dependent phosphohydrolase [Treponema sp.]
MVKKGTVVLVRDAMAGGKDYINACIKENVTVICVSRETGNNKYMPFKGMYENNNQFWSKNEAWEYFISNEDFAKAKEAVKKYGSDWKPIIKDNGEVLLEPDNALTEQGFGTDYESIVAMPEPERIEQLKENKIRLDNLIVMKPRQEGLITEALVETAQNAMLHNHAALMNTINKSGDESKKQTQELVDSTRELVKSSVQLISTNIFNDDLMNALVAKSNGTIIQHMTRVYLNGLAFLSYYNNIVTTSSMINKLRISFDNKQRKFYHSLMPHIHPDDISLEKVFLGGMRAIPESHFYDWATGFLVHDIGKAADVEYHEGEAAYNRDIVVQHVKIGYTSIMNKTNYPREAGLITGYHHEYYGDPGGYGYFRSYLDDYKKANPLAKQEACIAYELEPMLDFETLAYFPAKILEIIDVFDSVTDPNRKYRKAMTTEEALAMMHEEFIVKHPKIDLILYDIFAKFAREKAIA